MTKKDKDKGKPEPPIVLVLAGKPELVVHKADLTVTARALAKLLAEKCDYLFVHGGKSVIVELGEDDAPPTMRPAGVNEVIIAAHKHCQPVHQKPSERHEVTLPDKVAELYLAMPEEWRLRPLRGITTAPILHDDGSIRWERGYDAATSLLCACNLPALSLPDKPSRDDAKSALATLRRAFRTFAFADRKIVIEKMNADGETINVEVVDLEQPPGRDESAHLHALLGAVARFSLPLAPGYRVVAPELSGSRVGKGKLAHAISIVAFGKKINAAALGERKEEFDKGLTDKLLSGEQSILFDNLNNQTLRSRLLCVVLGESDADLRRLGAGMETARPAFIAVTGNGLKLAEDIVPRFITSELDAKCEHPEQRRFAGDFLADIARQRPELLRAALIIWRWGRQTKPKSKGTPPLGGFELWAAWIRDPLVALGCQEPVAQIAKAKAADPKRLNTAEIFQTWWGHHSNNGIKSNDLHDDVKALIEPDLKKRSRQNITTRVGRLVGTRLAGFHLCSDEDDKKKGEKGLWTPTVYWLEKTDETPAAEARPDAADDPDDWQFHREGDDAARPAAAEASGEPGSVASVPAFLTTPVKDELRGFGCTEEYILHVLPADAHAFLAQRRKLAGVLTAWSTTIGPGQPRTVEQVFADAEMVGTNDSEVSDELKRALAAVTNGADNMPLGQWLRENSGIEVGQLVLREAGTDKHGRPQWTLELRVERPAASEVSDDAIDARGFSQERVTEPPLPTDPVKRWRQCFARLDPARDPCAGFRTGDWPRICDVIRTFLASPFVKYAADFGWSDLELFGVHPEVGVARPNACGALMTNAYGSPVTQVTPLLIRFANGLAVYKSRLGVGNSVAVWDYREPAANECATCRIGSPPWSEERNT